MSALSSAEFQKFAFVTAPQRLKACFLNMANTASLKRRPDANRLWASFESVASPCSGYAARSFYRTR